MATLTSSKYESPVGTLSLVSSQYALRAVLWPTDDGSRVDVGRPSAGASPLLDRVRRQLDRYFQGSLRSFDLPLELVGTDFQRSVWTAVEKVEWGATATYTDLAVAIDRPNAVRAVASAVGRNPLSIVIGCHRIVGRDGSLRGYAGGLPAKKFLLDLEGWSAKT